MKTQLPAHARTTCPCPIIELAFARLEALCPFPDELVTEARELGKCQTNGALQRKRAESIVGWALNTAAGTDMETTGGERMAAIRGTAAYAHALLVAGRLGNAVVAALDALALSVPMRRGHEEDQLKLWREIVGRVTVLRGMA